MGADTPAANVRTMPITIACLAQGHGSGGLALSAPDDATDEDVRARKNRYADTVGWPAAPQGPRVFITAPKDEMVHLEGALVRAQATAGQATALGKASVVKCTDGFWLIEKWAPEEPGKKVEMIDLPYLNLYAPALVGLCASRQWQIAEREIPMPEGRCCSALHVAQALAFWSEHAKEKTL